MIFICGSLSCHDVTLNDRVKIMLSLLSWRIKAIYVYWSAVPPAEQPIGSRGQRFVFLSQKKKSCSLCFKNVNISHLYITCNLFLSSSSIVSSSFVCMAACGCSRGRCRLRLVCACVCSRTHHRWRNCQESVIRIGRVTLGRRRNMKYYKPLFCLITSESLALKCSSCGLWHVLWEAHSCGTSLNFISWKKINKNLWRLWNNCTACWYDIISLAISGEK